MHIGFFDSGVGGRYIMDATRAYLQGYTYIYQSDEMQLPYGEKSEKEIYTLTKVAVASLFERGAGLVIVACNTASAETLRMLQDEYVALGSDRKVLGVIIPTVEEVIESLVRKPLILATTRTVTSHKYKKEIRKRRMAVAVTEVATPALVPLIEEGMYADAMDHVRPLLATHREGGGDSVVLGCTHYCVLKDLIRAEYDMTVFSPDEIIPKKVKTYLMQHSEIEKKLTRNNKEQTVAAT